jgi:hypothetical protein
MKIIKTTIILLLAALAVNLINAQGCLPEGITFTTQEEIDNFQVNYPGCIEIEGTVTIEGYNDISNLNGLNAIEKISNDLLIVHNYNLQNLQGLNALTEIQGGLTIAFNNGLLNFSGMESLSVIGNNINIIENTGLVSCSGLENLATIPGSLGIGDNPSLQYLSGFNNLEYVGFMLIIESNPALLSLQGLNNIDHIGEDLILENNALLEDITALSDLTSIGDYLHIKGNGSLSSLTGIENIQANSINALTVIENPILQDCDVQSICDYLSAPNGTIEIHDNAPGCNSPEEVLLACETAVNENKTDELTIFPIPTTRFITITTPQGEPALEAIIYNHLGQKVVFTKPVNNTVDVSGLKAGMYLIEISTKDRTERTKLVKN